MYFNYFLPETRPLIGWPAVRALVSGGKWLEFFSQFQIKGDYNVRKKKWWKVMSCSFELLLWNHLTYWSFDSFWSITRNLFAFIPTKNNCNFLKICLFRVKFLPRNKPVCSLWMRCANLFMPRIPRIVYVPEPFFAIFITIPFTITGMYTIFLYWYFFKNLPRFSKIFHCRYIPNTF